MSKSFSLEDEGSPPTEKKGVNNKDLNLSQLGANSSAPSQKNKQTEEENTIDVNNDSMANIESARLHHIKP